MQPERIRISDAVIEVHPSDYVTVTRQPDGEVAYGPVRHVAANVRVYLDGEDGFFAFGITPAQARELLAAVERNSPDAED